MTATVDTSPSPSRMLPCTESRWRTVSAQRGDASLLVCQLDCVHMQIVQFAGKCMTYHDATEWNVTHAILSNSLAVSSAETRLKRNEQVDAVMREHGLVHIGWLRQASKMCPLSSLDLDTQRVRVQSITCAPASLRLPCDASGRCCRFAMLSIVTFSMLAAPPFCDAVLSQCIQVFGMCYEVM